MYIVDAEKGKNFADSHFADIVSHRVGDFTGTISLYTVNNRLMKGYGYKNGKQTFVRKLVGKPKGTSTTGGPVDNEATCTVYYWVDVYDDGSEMWTYEGTECIDSGGDSGGGTGGVGDPNSDQCTADAVQAAQEMSSGSVVFIDQGSDVSDVDGPSGVKKYKDPSWICYSAFGFNVTSYEKGMIELIDPGANKWVWDYLNHNRLQVIGSPIAGDATANEGSATSTFVEGTPNVTSGGMNLSFSITYKPASVTCLGVRIGLSPYTIPYTAHATFPALP